MRRSNPARRPHRRSSAISGLGGRAAIISITRLLNRGLLLISPLVLVRLLSVEDFGLYREFLLYTTILLGFSALGISGSLLRFIPARPELKWRFVSQTVTLTLATSMLTALAAWLLDASLGGKAMGQFALPAILYTLLFVNLDFWEYLLLAEKRSFAVLGYTTGRLIARIVTVITAALLTRDVTVIIWSLVGLEAARLMISFTAWRRRVQPIAADSSGSWREQLEYCLPFGGSMLLSSLNSSLGSLFITKALGPAALAQYAIGTYVHPVVTVLRNSLSDVLLPEMIERAKQSHADRLLLFRRTSVIVAIGLLGAGVVLARFAEILIVTLFSEEYRPAVLVMQIYLLAFVREGLDFGVPLRAIGRTAPIMHSNLIALCSNAALLLLLMPALGLIGAVVAYVVSRMLDGAYLGFQVARAYNVPLREIAAWRDLGKTILAAAVAALVLYWPFWTEQLGLAGMVVAAILYFSVFAGLLLSLRVPESLLLARRLLRVSALRR